jgi:hypothetical protein
LIDERVSGPEIYCEIARHFRAGGLPDGASSAASFYAPASRGAARRVHRRNGAGSHRGPGSAPPLWIGNSSARLAAVRSAGGRCRMPFVARVATNDGCSLTFMTSVSTLRYGRTTALRSRDTCGRSS